MIRTLNQPRFTGRGPLPESGDPFGDGYQDPAPAAPVKGDATEKQLAFLRKLMDERSLSYEEETLAKLSKRDASSLIDTLIKTPKSKAPAAPRTPSAEITEGMYRNPETGEIFKVQRAVHGSGHLYAKRLWVEKDEETGETYAEFVMARGVIFKLRPEWKMTFEDAKAFGALYGVCCSCSLDLTNEDSIFNGYGRKCASNHGWPYEKAPKIKR